MGPPVISTVWSLRKLAPNRSTTPLSDATRPTGWLETYVFDVEDFTERADGIDAGLIRSTMAAIATRPLRLGRCTAISSFRMGATNPDAEAGSKARSGGTQAVARALDILDAIAEEPMLLDDLANRVGLSRTTCYRIANALVERGLLATSGRSGYALGERIDELAAALRAQR